MPVAMRDGRRLWRDGEPRGVSETCQKKIADRRSEIALSVGGELDVFRMREQPLSIEMHLSVFLEADTPRHVLLQCPVLMERRFGRLGTFCASQVVRSRRSAETERWWPWPTGIGCPSRSRAAQQRRDTGWSELTTTSPSSHCQKQF